MPSVASVEALERAAAEFEVGETMDLVRPHEAMAKRILVGATAALGTLVVAGNAHTPGTPTSLGIPLGACLARQRPGVLSNHINYGGGHFYNLEPRRFHPLIPRVNIRRSQIRLRQQRRNLVLDLPEATEAIVPQRPSG